MAVSSDHVLDRSGPTIPPRLGTGSSWKELAFDDSRWPRGPGPFGFNHPSLGTDLEDLMKTQTPSLYLRTSFVVTGEQIERAVRIYLDINYDDGFVAYLNGRELGRRHLGLPGQFVYADQSSFQKRFIFTREVLELEWPMNWLQPGTNVLAIQTHAAWSPQDFNPSRFTLLMDASLHLGDMTAPPLAAGTNQWSYFVGLVEPSGSYMDHDALAGDPASAAFGDWVELKNRGDAGLDLAGWSLTDDPDEPRKWVFPSVTLPAGGYVTVFCSGLDKAVSGQTLHANFKLEDRGEYVGLFDAQGFVVHEIPGGYPPQSVFHSYGLDSNAGRYVYFSTPTPGQPNGGEAFAAICDMPLFGVAEGFHAEAVAVSLRIPGLGTTIRYTLDGSEPTLVNGHDYTHPVVLVTNTTLRARAYRPGWIPSRIGTKTYLIAQPDALRTIPTLALGADPRRALYEPEGVTTIHGGRFGTDDVWDPLIESDYNIATMYGRAFERPVSFEWLSSDGEVYVQADCGLRLAGSSFSRPRMTMLNLEDTVWRNGWPNKPSFSFFFRNDYGPAEIGLDLIPGEAVATFDTLRLRAGKNDWINPFIRDEVVRRLYHEMGHLTSRGQFCNFFVNGHFKGYFNLVERLRLPFYRVWTGSTNEWDVRFVDEIEEGDAVRWNQDMAFMRSAAMDVPANYTEAARRFDLENFVDYLVLNIYAAMADWPRNNWFAARERTADGQWRFQVWDAEGSFGRATGHNANHDTITADLIIPPPLPTTINRSIQVLFTVLQPNPEFQLLFADRLQRHMFGSGTLTRDNVVTHYMHWRDALAPMVDHVFNQELATDYFLDWVEDRPPRMLADCRAAGLWPETEAPVVDPAGTILQPNTSVSLANPNPGGDIYYTVDGTDPRAVGGDASGSLYAGPFVPGGLVLLKARVLRNGEWSPLTEVEFQYPMPSTLEITEIHYNPVGTAEFDGPDFEFVEIQNTGAAIVDLTGVGFSDGIEFAFTNGPVLAPGEFAVVAAHAGAFSSRYPGPAVAGVYQGKLDNSGERLTLSFLGDQPLFTVRYNDLPPWPVPADGAGFSLVPSGAGGVDPEEPEYWRASFLPNGSPGMADPEPNGAPIYITEILSRRGAGGSSLVELFNAGSVAVDVSGWYVSTSTDEPFQYRLPSGSILPPGGFLMANQSSLVTLPGSPPFALSPIGGLIGLYAADAAGELTGHAHFVEFDAAWPDVSQGRHVDSLGRAQFVHLVSPTFGWSNAAPRVGPVVINEIHYDTAQNATRYLELANTAAQPAALYREGFPALAWRLDGVDFEFPPGTTLAPGEIILLSEGDPNVLRIHRDVPPAVRIFGPWSGNLDRGGETLRLEEPDWIVTGSISNLAYVPLDAVRYNDKPPWPVEAGGGGASLQRVHPVSFGNDPNSWYASSLTPGRGNSPEGVPEPRLTLTAPIEGSLLTPGQPVTFQVDLQDPSGPVAAVEYYLNGDLVGQSDQPPYELTLAPPRGRHFVQAVARIQPGLAVSSQTAEIRVLQTISRGTVLVPEDAVWKYDDRGMDLGQAWTASAYDDSSWSEGPAQLGYGEDDEATVVGYGEPSPNRNVTTYFRHAFTVPAGLDWDVLAACVVRDDGAVVHINGQEAGRSNMPEGPVDYLTYASGASTEENIPVSVPLESGLIQEGANQLAVEIHQVHRSSPDMSFALELVAAKTLVEPWIARQPAGQVVAAGQGATLEVEAVGEELVYQWYDSNGRTLPGANGPVLELDALMPGDATGYYVKVANDAGTATSEAANLRIIEPDTDWDGMPDHWEILHGFDLDDAGDAQEDADGDGVSNVSEYERGTDPRAVDHKLFIQSANGGGSALLIHLEFQVPRDASVTLQRAANLEELDWTTLRTFGPWSTNSHQIWEAEIDGASGFYRLLYEGEE